MVNNYFNNNNLFFIAEIGLNHGGSFKKAKKMIVSASKCGASAVKFQTYNTLERTPNSRPDLKKIFKENELNKKEHEELKIFAENNNLIFFSTVFDIESLKFLESINLPLYKIASFDISNIPLLKAVSSTKKPTIISTGMATIEEIIFAKQIFDDNKCETAFLHCVSSYPTLEKEAYLSNIDVLKSLKISNIGISDHTQDIKVPQIAVAMGARIIEKHFKLKNDINCIDSVVSIDALQFSEMIETSKNVLDIQGTPNFGIKNNEKQASVFKRTL